MKSAACLTLTLSPQGRRDNSLTAGVDEVGRGPLAGPLIAAAVILDPQRRINGLADSKQLTALQRDKLFILITQQCKAYALGRAEVEEIERYNIHHANLLAMQRAVQALIIRPERVLVDGIHCPQLDMPVEAIVHGDSKIASISAASIIAKVSRDREMIELDALYPEYGFAQHKGYATPQHKRAIQKFGICPIHRRTFGTLQNERI